VILFKGGWVFDGAGQRLDGHGVLIEDARIAKVAPLSEFDSFTGEAVDTTGATLLPGLIDCHVHLVYSGHPDPRAALAKQSPAEITLTALENAQKNLAGGITAVRDCGGKDHLEFAVRDAIGRGIFRGPTIHAAGRMICMTGGHGNAMGRVADGPEEVVKAVREQIHAGCDLVKIMATGGVMTPGVNPEDAHYSAEEMKAGVTEARRFHKRTASHAQGTEGILNAVRAGIHSIEHGIFMTEKCIEEMKEGGVYLVATISALKNIVANAGNGVPAYAVEKSIRVSEDHLRSVRMFHAAGGKFAMGTDAGTPFNYHGDNAQELAHLVDYGLSPSEALMAATAHGADLMGLADIGRIEAGKQADLLLVEGDPTKDIRMAAERTNHRAVYKAGVAVPLNRPAARPTWQAAE
jgi:imidazolonepropionase-like amidohydrolase